MSIFLALLAIAAALLSRITAWLLVIVSGLLAAGKRRKISLAFVAVAALFTGWSTVALLRPYPEQRDLDLDNGGTSREVLLPLEVEPIPFEADALVAMTPGADEEYSGFELQRVNRGFEQGYRLLGYRQDGYVDGYDDPTLTVKREDEFQVIGNGLKNYVTTPLHARLEKGVFQADFTAHDGLHIHIDLTEHTSLPSVDLPILAPVGASAKHPSYFPLFVLNDFSFMRTSGATKSVQIDGREMGVEGATFLLQSQLQTMVKYSTDVDLFKVFPAGHREIRTVRTDGDIYRDGDIQYSLAGRALKTIAVREHEITFDPPLDVTRDLSGRMEMRTNPHNAIIAGPYTVSNGELRITIDTAHIPNQRDFEGWVMMKALGFFEQWPKGYEFTARIQGATIESEWVNTTPLE